MNFERNIKYFSNKARIARQVSDAEIDQDVADQAALLESTAIQRFNLDSAQVGAVDPLLVAGFDYHTARVFRQGNDGKVRTNIAEAVIVLFELDVLHAYKVRFSLTNPTDRAEEAHTYFYQDVVSISTATGTVDSTIGKVAVDQFRLTTAGGTSLECALLNEKLSERSIQGARTLILERKRR